MTFSAGSRYPMKRPNAANTTEPTQARPSDATSAPASPDAPLTRPTAATTSTAASPMTIATATLVKT